MKHYDNSKRHIFRDIYTACHRDIYTVGNRRADRKEASENGMGQADERKIRRDLCTNAGDYADSVGGETGMKDFTDLKLAKAAEFDPAKAEGEYCVIDFETEEKYKYYENMPLDEVFTRQAKCSLYIVYKEKSPCGNTD